MNFGQRMANKNVLRCSDPKCTKGNYKLQVDYAVNALLVRCVSENEIASL